MIDEYAPSQAVKPITFMVDLPQQKQIESDEEEQVGSDT